MNDQETIQTGGSEFLDAVAGKDINYVMALMNEFVEAVKATNPQLYKGIIDALKTP